MPEIKEEKRSLRAFYKEKRAELPKDKKALLDGMICSELISLDKFAASDIILTFAPSFLEPDINRVATEALRLGKKLAFPICDKATHTMTFRYVTTLDELVAGSYSIPEPPGGNEAYSGEASALCVVPALSFDSEGYRLGYGGGYYDRFLKSFKGISVGVVYSEFVCEKLPHGEFDLKTDIIITERGRF